MRTNADRAAQRGVTLVELLVVVSIVAILGTIAVANYRSSALRSNRAEATAALLRIQAQQEKYYLNRNTYTADPALLGLAANTERGLYRLQVVVGANGDTFTATATATGSQTADRDCPVFTINETGARTPVPGDANRCWR
jgi:type IV pilus assembly protein PilE